MGWLAGEDSEHVFGLALAPLNGGDGRSGGDVGGEDEVLDGEEGVLRGDGFDLGDVERAAVLATDADPEDDSEERV